MWKYLSGCVAGTSHRSRDLPCQDAVRVEEVPATDGPVLVVAIADGAGSATSPDVGARIACDTLLTQARGSLLAGVRVDGITEALLGDWFLTARLEIEREAERRQVRSRELACTAILAVVGETAAAFAQIGDGAVVLSGLDGYTPVFWPQEGEYANTTTFLTDDTALGRLARWVGPCRVTELAAFTDGVQRVAMDYTTRRGHPGFFTPLFDPLRTHPNPAALQEPLLQFLDSAAINNRTDDDKTLVLATWEVPCPHPPI